MRGDGDLATTWRDVDTRGYILEREAMGVLRGGSAVKSGGVHESPEPTVMKHHRLGTLNNPNELPHGSGG